MLCFRTLCVLGGGICRPRVNGLARVDERGVCFVVVPIKYSVGVRHALIAPQSYDVRVHVYTYSKHSILFPLLCGIFFMAPRIKTIVKMKFTVWSDILRNDYNLDQGL